MSAVAAAIIIIGTVLKIRTYRLIVFAAALLFLGIYLAAIRQLLYMPFALSASYPIPSVQVAADWTAKLFRQMAPLTYEPVAVLILTRRLMWMIAVPNVLIGVMLGILFGLNAALAAYSLRCARACGTRTAAAFVGIAPSLLTGAACCGPSIALVLGTNAALALAAVRGWLLPSSILLLVLSALWTARGLTRASSLS